MEQGAKRSLGGRKAGMGGGGVGKQGVLQVRRLKEVMEIGCPARALVYGRNMGGKSGHAHVLSRIESGSQPAWTGGTSGRLWW